jgi:hypothetical protein
MNDHDPVVDAWITSRQSGEPNNKVVTPLSQFRPLPTERRKG